MSYIPNTKREQRRMLDTIGVSTIDELFSDIPENLRIQKRLKLPRGMSEYELSRHMYALAKENINADTHTCFLGGGIYDHYIPSVVNHIAGRQEFYTAYTPYQAEMSQGTLQVMFEYQTFMARLTGMDISNASVYDGGTACAEAMLLAHNVNRKNEVILLSSLNIEYIKTCHTYAKYRSLVIKEAPLDMLSGTVDMESLKSLISDDTSCVIVQSPNYFGVIEDIKGISEELKERNIILIAVANPISLGILKPPGDLGADLVVGEGQPLGSPMNFGGPGFGYFTCRSEYLRKMPGRIAGKTADKDSNRGFVLTIQAREQHIRRERATSNICSNQALNTLRASIYLALLGSEGFKSVSELCCKKAHYMYNRLLDTHCFEPKFSAPFFNEFVVKYKGCVKKLKRRMTAEGILPGIDLSYRSGFEGCLLTAVTEKRTKAEIDDFVKKAVSSYEGQ